MLKWLPPQTEAATGVTRACLRAQRDAALSRDNLVPTVLSLMGVSSGLLEPALDLAAPCHRQRSSFRPQT